MSMNFVTSIFVVIVVLGLMILVHELGHFLAAKLFRVRVLTFSIGFGKRLFGFKRGDTDYRVSVLPLGGYVKMAGDDPSEVREGDPAEFLMKPRWQRFIIAIMGPTMNIVMAVLLLTGLYRFHFPKPAFMEQPVLVGDVAPDSPAAKAGIQPGDTVVRLGDLQNPNWETFRMRVMIRAGEALPVEVLRDGQTLNLTMTPKAVGSDQVGESGLAPCVPGQIGPDDQIAAGKPADKAGLRNGDKFVSVNGEPIRCWQQVITQIQAGQGKPIDMTILRDGKEVKLSVTPYWGDSGNGNRWLIGISFPTTPSDVVVRQLPLAEAFSTALDDNLRNCVLTFEVLGRILTRRMSAKSLSGPIGIIQISERAYREGLPNLLMLISFISLQLGIFNLLPIPILDGGMILMLLIESVMRRDLSLAVKERFAQVGIAFLLLLAVFVTYNDIKKTLWP
jgi:regulator of sigma E protease